MKKNIRAIISYAGSPMKNEIIRKTLDHFSVSQCTIVYIKNTCSIKNCKKVLWLKFEEIIYGRYPEKWSSCIPIDEPLLEKLSSCETTVLQMMNRIDWDETISYEQRKKIYLKHVLFWNNEILTKKINVCIFLNIPHEIYDYVLYSLCKIYNIPVVCLSSQRFQDTTIITSDYRQVSPKLLSEYNRLSLEYKYQSLETVKTIVSDAFIKKITYFSFLSDVSFLANFKKKFSGIISYTKEILRALEKNPWKIISQLCNPLFLLHRIKSIIIQYVHTLYYWNLSKNPDFTKKFIYIPLHYQPECTTSPMGGIFVNQELIVYLLHQLLPKNIYLYVKEHPVTTTSGMRSCSFYKSLTESPRIILIRKHISSQDLIKHSIATATATGTAGWEALIQQRPVLMFGYDFYQFAPGVFQITSTESCADAIDKIINKKYTPSLKELLLFYKAMENVFIDGYIDEYYRQFSRLSNKQNTDNIATALTEAIDKSLKKENLC